jgi:signal transduction histidine kinase
MEAFEKQVQKEVYQSKIEFFTQITHEIKTPLTLIKGPLDELLKDKNFNSEKNQNLQIIDKNTDRLLTLTKELLDFRKIEKENYHLSFVKLNIIALLSDLHL